MTLVGKEYYSVSQGRTAICFIIGVMSYKTCDLIKILGEFITPLKTGYLLLCWGEPINRQWVGDLSFYFWELISGFWGVVLTQWEFEFCWRDTEVLINTLLSRLTSAYSSFRRIATLRWPSRLIFETRGSGLVTLAWALHLGNLNADVSFAFWKMVGIHS